MDLKSVVLMFDVDIYGSDSTLELNLKGTSLALLGGGGYEEAGVKNDRVMGTENAHFPDGESII